MGLSALSSDAAQLNDETDTVSVIDGTTNAIIATMPAQCGPNGIAVNSDNNRIYETNNCSDSSTLLVYTGKTNQAIAKVFLGTTSEPGPAAVNPKTNRIYLTEYNHSQVAVIQD